MKRKNIKETLSNLDTFDTLFAIGIIVFLICLLMSVWIMFLPLDQAMEIRCRTGDSVACLSVPR